jgi:hypothetical protein
VVDDRPCRRNGPKKRRRGATTPRRSPSSACSIPVRQAKCPRSLAMLMGSPPRRPAPLRPPNVPAFSCVVQRARATDGHGCCNTMLGSPLRLPQQRTIDVVPARMRSGADSGRVIWHRQPEHGTVHQ